MSDEWYTPSRYVEAAREVMNGIDVDPASCEMANQIIKATKYYTREENGLEHPWHGRIWLNPPFGRRQTPGAKTNQGYWILKLIEEYQAGRVTEAILLTTCRPDTSWFASLWQFSICFTDHKVGFYTPEAGQILQEVSHAHGTLFVYLGPNEHRFLTLFSKFGRIAKAITPLPLHPVSLTLWNRP
jgi:hypothetical protein